MRKAVLCVAVLGFLFGASAQDGLYGSFLLGQKFVNNMPAFNDAVKQNLGAYTLRRDFAPNYFTLGGQGYLLMAKRLMLGGKAWAFTSGEIVVDGTDIEGDDVPTRKVSLSGGIGLGTVGFSILPPNRLGLHLYPQLGLGVAPFVFHSKRDYEGDVAEDSLASFEYIVRTGDDQQATLAKGSFVIDVCVGADLHPFKIVFPLFPGIHVWPLIHLEAGYSIIPGNIEWVRGATSLGEDDWQPDIKADGFYIVGGIGVGITPKQD